LAIVESADGNVAEFTLSGGENYMAVRVDGFNMLTVPKIQEYIGGEWVDYVVSSIGSPDAYGYGYAYDGYGVAVGDGGKYSYSFIVDMTDAEDKSDNGARTFRVSADTEFTGWETVKLEQPVGPVELIKEADDIYDSLINSAMGVGKYNKFDENEDGVTDYVRIFSKGSYEVDGETKHVGESAFTIKNSGSPVETGRYLFFKYRIPTTNTYSNNMQVWLDSDTGESNYKTISCKKNGWQFALIDMKTGSTSEQYDDNISLGKLRIDYLEGSYIGNITLDFGFVGLFDSEEAAYDYYGKYVSKYNLNHTCIYGEWTLHGVGENEDYRSCMVCGNVETRTAVHESNDVWSHGEEYDFKHCILCGNVSEQRPAEHTASGEWIYGETTDIQNCTECNGVAVSRSHTHSYNDDPWHHIQGEALEERTCVTCNATETRYTKAVGWISLTDYSTYTDGKGQTQTYSVRSSLNSATADASSLKLNFSEENGYYLTLIGEWLAVNGGIYNYVYKINDGEWKDFGYVHYDSTKEYSWGKAYIDAIGQDLGNDVTLSAKGGFVQVTGKPKRIELGDVSGDGICITIAIVPYDNQSAIVPIFTFTNIQGPEYFTEGLIFEKNAAGDGYTVTGYEGSATEIVIPSVYRSLPVNKIAEGAITREMLEAGLTVNCEGYTYENGLLIETSTGTLIAGCGSTVEIPETVKTIGTKAFYGCTELTSLYIPSSVMSIGENAFAGCVNLARIEYASSSKRWENLSANAGITSDPEYIFALSVIGDLNGDGKITSYEVLECARYLASIDPATGEASKTIDINADINSDGKINILDLILIRQQVVAE
jgi:hypothetical protein